jgi:hypothetical protein
MERVHLSQASLLGTAQVVAEERARRRQEEPEVSLASVNRTVCLSKGTIDVIATEVRFTQESSGSW